MKNQQQYKQFFFFILRLLLFSAGTDVGIIGGVDIIAGVGICVGIGAGIVDVSTTSSGSDHHDVGDGDRGEFRSIIGGANLL